MERFKARFVAKGYTQIYSVNYTETYSLLAKVNKSRVLLSLTANLDVVNKTKKQETWIGYYNYSM